MPETPGVYIFRDAQGVIIYIGKAKSLKKRVQTYFSRQLDSKTQAMVEKIADIEYRSVPSESSAQVLEATLIKDNQPQYNIDLKDDKSFPWIRITGEDFPVVSICRTKRQEKNDTALYFGPYTNVKLLRKALKVIRAVFGFRSCKNLPEEACLYYRLKLCPAPCIRKISKAQYRQLINQIKLFLESRYEELMDTLGRDMKVAAREKQFEEAARIRDQIQALSAFRFSPSVPAGMRELEDLKNLLQLKRLPLRIEAFDISNIQGTSACGSMVSFYKGAADKNNYRRFRIKTVSGIDDYQMIAEVVGRRYSRLLKENLALPDLVLIDGGKQHLSVAVKELKKLGLDLAVASIAKDRENIYRKNKIHPIHLDADTPALNLIRRVRDEAHRFAIAYHHLLMRKKTLGA